MRRLAIAMLAVLLPRAVAAQTDGCDPGMLEIREVSVSGNDKFQSGLLENSIVTAPTSWMRRNLGIPLGPKRCLDSLDVQRDALRIRLYYRLHGYYKTAVTSQLEPDGTTGVKVRFTIKEGPPVIIDSLTVTGLDSVRDRDELLKLFKPFQHGIFSAVALSQVTDTVIERLHGSGYPYAEKPLQSTQVDSSSEHAIVSIQFFERIGDRTQLELPSHRARIGKILYDISPGGDSSEVSENTIRKMLSFQPGDIYDEGRLARSERDLYQLETYRRVTIQRLPADSQPSDTLITVRVTVAEGKMRTIRLGGGWATLDCLRFQTRYVDRNFAGSDAKRLVLLGRISRIALCTPSVRSDTLRDSLNYYASAQLRLPSLLGPRTTPSFTVYSERTSEFEAYLRSTPIGAAVELTRDLKPRGYTPFLPVTLTYRIEYGHTSAQPAVFCQLFNQCSPADIARLQENSLLQIIGGAIARNNADNILDPSTGDEERLALETGTTSIQTGGNTRFSRALGQVTYYKPIGRSVLAAGLQIGGVFEGFSFDGATSYVPPEERLYAGGPNSVRGYGQNLLGPLVYIVNGYEVVDSAGKQFFRTTDSTKVNQRSATGGNASIVANVEWRIRSPFLTDILQLAIFVDGGYVWNRPDQTIQPLRWTPGVGIRVRTPIGPIRVDFGYNGYAPTTGPAYFSTTDNQLLCVSPGNTFEQGVIPSNQSCPASYAPPPNTSFISKITFNFSIGQAF
ncbi:MAG TPA: BamA/TamA family outer membrane protein [Gemmatimonadaceae bacterium]|nr:BamA/TamA family outer membrane protein [Gemmatimonadaceae bacterium]